jgi:hypothetical protein
MARMVGQLRTGQLQRNEGDNKACSLVQCKSAQCDNVEYLTISPSLAMNLTSQVIHSVRMLFTVTAGTLLFSSCSATAQQLSASQMKTVGQRIWQNECSGTVAGLTSWNKGEDFASLGIGHFIWYAKGKQGPFEESFPPLVSFLQANGVPLPSWLPSTPDCPWKSKAAFDADAKGARQADLRQLLSKTVGLQTAFIMRRLQKQVPAMIQAGGDAAARSHALLSQTPEGMFAMIDYINFKGEGLKSTERYKGQGWGLAQVLGAMRAQGPADAPAAFAAASKSVLSRRVANASALGKKEQQWLAGWHNRCDRYKQKL